MVELSAKAPCADLLPIQVGTVTLEEVDAGVLTALSPLGKPAALSKALEAAHGMVVPEPNRSTGKEGARCVWFGLREVLLMGPRPDDGLARHAALVDQSDAWAVVKLSGVQAVDVLARLVPVDLRVQSFKRGHTVRSQLLHMNASITRVSSDGFMILVFRSMAGTLVHDLKTAMAGVAARG